ncbi:MAG: hypothetical protein R3A79_16685 [Nannocystaceae bacterium]
MRALVPATLALLLAAAPGCAADTGDRSAAGAATAANVRVELRKFKLQTAAPAGAEARDEFVGDGVMLQGPALLATVVVADDLTPATVDAAKESNAAYDPRGVEVDALADGWALTWTSEGDMGVSYWVQVRREIAGVAYWCTSTTTAAAMQRNAVVACKGLEPAA